MTKKEIKYYQELGKEYDDFIASGGVFTEVKLPKENDTHNPFSTPKYTKGDKVKMFPNEPFLLVTEVNEWADKLPTYDLKSEDESIVRNNISEDKINPNELSINAQGILDRSMIEYEKADDKKKSEFIKIVQDQLAKNEHGLKHIGMGLDQDSVAAGKEFLKLTKEPLVVSYPDIKSCILSEGDEESYYIFEGKEFIGAGEKWRIISFFKYGMVVEHIHKNSLHDKKENKEITFSEFKNMYSAGDVDVFGIDSLHKLNHCLKIVEKCIDLVDEKQAHHKTKLEAVKIEEPELITNTNKNITDSELIKIVGENAFQIIKKQEEYTGDIINRRRVVDQARIIAKIEGGDEMTTQSVAEAVQYEFGYVDNWQDLRNVIKKGGIELNQYNIERMIEIGIKLPSDIISELNGNIPSSEWSEAKSTLELLLQDEVDNEEWKEAIETLELLIKEKEEDVFEKGGNIPSKLELKKLIDQLESGMTDLIKNNETEKVKKGNILIGQLIDLFNESNKKSPIVTHAQWESAILETVGKNHYLRMNGESWKLTDEQLIELNKELEPINNPLTAAKYLLKKDKSEYEKVTISAGGNVSDETDKEIFESQFGK